MGYDAGLTGERDLLILSARAGAAINPFRILKLGTDADEVEAAADGTVWPVGISGDGSENNKGTYAENDYVNVKYSGIAKLSMSGTGSKGDRVVATTGGQGTRHAMDTEGVYIIGFATEDWTNGQVISVLINRLFFADTEGISTAL